MHGLHDDSFNFSISMDLCDSSRSRGSENWQSAMVTDLLYWAMELVGAVAITMSVSAYTNAEGVYPFQGQTYSGEYTRPGVCACGWSYPIGTHFIINGKEYTCLDRGSAITDNHIDIWFADVEEAIKWGRQELQVLAILPREYPKGAFHD